MSNYNNLYIIPIDPSVEVIVSLRLRLRAISSRTERNSLLSAELGPSYEPEMHNIIILNELSLNTSSVGISSITWMDV